MFCGYHCGNDDVYILIKEPKPFEDPVAGEIAAKHGKSPSQAGVISIILLKWLLQRDIIVIPKSTNPSHIVLNVQLFDFELSDAEMKALNEVKIRQRYVHGDTLRNALRKVLDVGCRHIDTAHYYQNEDVIGEVLQQWFASGAGKREDVFVVTKLPWHSRRRDEVERSLKESLAKLKLDYVDLYLVHTAQRGAVRKTFIYGMEDVFSKGLTRSIGISNFNIDQITNILDNSKVKPHNLQVECHLYWPQFELHEFCKRHNISFTAYAPLGSPGRSYQLPNILLKWLLQRGIIVIPKSTNPSHIASNVQLFDFELSDAEMKALNDVKIRQQNFRF
ncbi:Alcohol dehydrogenase NADP+ A [Trichuris trichiura]|uniref:Alcohol dehydrogenase NADP+ A n=1 Tax=Trichuris trichiura TaxID=36087 RepID=A0A077Z8G1_TRITR|nr:Alcohol dehydrogenase NADP+ A [Trichuris trichiura]